MSVFELSPPPPSGTPLEDVSWQLWFSALYQALLVAIPLNGEVQLFFKNTIYGTIKYDPAVQPNPRVVFKDNAGRERFGIDTVTGNFMQSVLTVATLPVVTYQLGARAFVTDANATMTAGIGGIVAGGGANRVPVYCDGVNWRIG